MDLILNREKKIQICVTISEQQSKLEQNKITIFYFSNVVLEFILKIFFVLLFKKEQWENIAGHL